MLPVEMDLLNNFNKKWRWWQINILLTIGWLKKQRQPVRLPKIALLMSRFLVFPRSDKALGGAQEGRGFNR